MTKRLITEYEEKLYRLCADDFSGLSEIEAAERLGISQQRVSQLLKDIRRKCPSLAPVRSPIPKTVSFDEGMHSDKVKEKF